MKVVCISINILWLLYILYIHVTLVVFPINMHSECASLRPALISVSCLLVVVSLLMFIIGFIRGHCFNQGRHGKLTQQERSRAESTAAASEHVEDLELKENVAYVTLNKSCLGLMDSSCQSWYI